MRKSIAAVNEKWDKIQGKLDDLGQAEVISGGKADKDLSWVKKQSYHLFPSIPSLEIYKAIRDSEVVAMDLETTGFDWEVDSVVGVSLSRRAGESIYIPIKHLKNPQDLFEMLSKKKLLFHNGKFDLKFCRKYVPGMKMWLDTMVLGYYMNCNQRVSLDALSKRYLNLDNRTFEELTKPFGGNMANVPLEEQMWYSCPDADLTFRMWEKFKDLPGIFPMIAVTMELSDVLMEAEMEGILMDQNVLKKGQEIIVREMQTLEEQIYEVAGRRFKIGSSEQVADVLYKDLGLQVTRKSKKTGKASTDKLTLKGIEKQHPIVGMISRYKSLTKGEGSYLQMLQDHTNPRDGKIHSSFMIAHVPTMRLSMEDPSLHNIPKQIEDLVNVRDAFVAPPDWYFMEADQKQVEFRLICYFAEIKGMIEGFESGEDPHRIVSGWMFGIPPDSVTDDQRVRGKTLNFGVGYGMGEWGLSQRLGCTTDVARGLLSKYYKAMHPLNDWKKEQIRIARKLGYVTLLYGSRRYIPYIQLRPAPSGTPKEEAKEIRSKIAKAERGVVNTLVQGGAAEVQRIAMVRVAREIKRRSLQDRMKIVLTVHDSVIPLVHKSIEIEEASEILKIGMEFPIRLYNKIIPVDVKYGQRLGSLKAMKEEKKYKLIEAEVQQITALQIDRMKDLLSSEGVDFVLIVGEKRYELFKTSSKGKLDLSKLSALKAVLPGVKICGIEAS